MFGSIIMSVVCEHRVLCEQFTIYVKNVTD